MLLKVRQRSVLKAVGDPGATDGLLAHAGDHLGDVNEGPCVITRYTRADDDVPKRKNTSGKIWNTRINPALPTL